MNCLMCLAPIAAGQTVCSVCGWTLTATLDDSLLIGTLLQQGKYRIEKKLGQGGFGITYLATDLTLKRKVALKELFQDTWKRQGQVVLTPSRMQQVDFQEVQDRFVEEARTLAYFTHSSIVRVYDHFRENNTAYIVMEYLEGESLAQRLQRLPRLSDAELIQLTINLGQALRLVHVAGRLHRDIKPENIILEKDGRTVLIDFGSARAFQAGMTTTMTRMITPGYAPLEQYATAGKVGPPTDIYALGATLYHAISGRVPPDALNLLTGIPLPALPKETPVGLARAIQQAMQVKLTDRPQNIDEFLS